MKLLGLMVPLLVSLSLLSGCGEKEKFVIYGSSENKKDVESILKEDYVEKTTVIQYDDSMLVAVQIKPWDKWRKTKLEKKLQKKFDKKFPNKEVFVSADYKIYYEANKIKKDKVENNILSDKITELKKLAKEET
ncbi:YhcN/YlaJ family sporulation lipoprotein [Lysinibacillus pakistanensis]|uniref:YhcN/YlaJ family sporulation lipoprotein n=1 Tax=Lysinibacillus TaxID=400634 RepID=UPI00257CF783|nr:MULTISPECIES: YhcN/YlaJ family sporulation lipoprotein [Lysinibacillus]